MTHQVLIGGSWRDARCAGTFQAENPQTGEMSEDRYPISTWDDCDEALAAAATAFQTLYQRPPAALAEFLARYAQRIERRRDELVACAHQETALPVSPRLAEVELPRTVTQLRQAAQAARDGSWSLATIDTVANIRSHFAPLGPVIVFGPNNFPFAFGSISGGDFAAALAAGNPVIAKANSSHPGTTRLFAQEAQAAAQETDMPPGTVQLLYRISHADGERLVADPRTGATGYTGSRQAGLKLKAAADAAGKPIYLELSSVNPVVMLPGVLESRCDELVQEFCGSCLMGTGQFCTNPGLVLLLRHEASERFTQAVAERFRTTAAGTLLSRGVQTSLLESVQALVAAGAECLAGGNAERGPRRAVSNTLLRVTGAQFLQDPLAFQLEAFGNASLFVLCDDLEQLECVLGQLEGNLTGCVYSDQAGSDDEACRRVMSALRPKVGRLLNDKMPTGVAVSPAMNHGGPYPATGHPGFTAVGIPASLRRFAMLQCFDAVRHDRLPLPLRNQSPNGTMWRLVDGRWTQDDVRI